MEQLQLIKKIAKSAIDGNFEDYHKFLEELQDVNLQDEDGNVILHYLAAFGNVELVKELIEKGADVKKINSQGFTPLHMAAGNNQLELVKLLLDSGSSVFERDIEGKSPIYFASDKELIDILVNLGNDVDDRDFSRNTPIFHAINEGRIKAAINLIAKGADLHATNGSGQNLLHVSAFKGYHLLALDLVKDGVSPYKIDANGKTPFALAQEQNHKFVLKVFEDSQGQNVDFDKIHQEILSEQEAEAALLGENVADEIAEA